MQQDFSWLATLADLSSRRVPCVLITVMEAKGSTPREAGAKMVVTTDGQFGTIGGGNLEFEAIAEARKLLDNAVPASTVKDYPLGPKLAQCCGGGNRIQRPGDGYNDAENLISWHRGFAETDLGEH